MLRRSKYAPLYEFLGSLEGRERGMSFSEVERVLGFGLPRSARAHSAWWANDASRFRHSWAWLEAGWETRDLDIVGESVWFVRVGIGGNSVKARCGKQDAPQRAWGILFPPVARGVGRFGMRGVALCLGWQWAFWYPVVSAGLGRHYTLLDVNRGWPRLGFSVGWVFGVFLIGLPLPGFPFGVAIWLPLGLDF